MTFSRQWARVLARRGAAGNTIAVFGHRTIVSDTFSRADNASTLGTAETGQAWTNQSGVFGIASQQAESGSGSPIATLNAGVSDGTLSCAVGANSTSNSNWGLIFRFSDVNNYWRFVYSGGSWFLQKIVAGASTTIQSAAGSVAVGDVHTVALAGSSITVKKNGTQLVTATDSFNQTATNHGMGSAALDANQRWDTFKVTT